MIKVIASELKENYGELKSEIKSEKYFILSLCGLAILFILSMFFEAFLIITILAMVAISVFFNFEKTLILFLFSCPFCIIFSIGNLIIFEYIYFLLFFICFVKYFFELFKLKKQLNKKVLSSLLFFLFYVSLPIFDVKVFDALNIITVLGVFYLLIENKSSVSLKRIVAYASIAMILASFLSLIIPFAQRLQVFLGEHIESGKLKFEGFLTNPNIYATLCNFLLALIVYFCLKKNGAIWFLPFLVIEYFAVQTLSRNFLFFQILLIIYFFIVICIKKDKRMAIGFCFFIFAFGLVMLIKLDYFCLYFSKLNFIGNEILNSEKIIDIVNNPYYSDLVLWEDGLPPDPGRLLLWKRYFLDFVSSPKNFIFGVGISADVLGFSVHSFFIQFLWRFGVIGVIITCFTLVAILIKLFKNFKSVRQNVMLLAVLFIGIIENLFFSMSFVYALILFVCSTQGVVCENSPKLAF